MTDSISRDHSAASPTYHVLAWPIGSGPPRGWAKEVSVNVEVRAELIKALQQLRAENRNIDALQNEDVENLKNFRAFKDWHERLIRALARQHTDEKHPFNNEPYKLRGIVIEAVTIFGGPSPKIGFMKVNADISQDQKDKKDELGNPTGDPKKSLPGAIFLRGGSVSLMYLLQPDDVPEDSEKDKYVILAIQPRSAAGSLRFVELPAGMIDNEQNIKSKVLQEAAEEIGEVWKPAPKETDLVDLTQVAAKQAAIKPGIEGKTQEVSESERVNPEDLRDALYPSPGACDEFITLYLYQKRLPRKDFHETITKLEGRLTGAKDENEHITLTVVPLEDLWKYGARDGKTLASLALYENIRKNLGYEALKPTPMTE